MLCKLPSRCARRFLHSSPWVCQRRVPSRACPDRFDPSSPNLPNWQHLLIGIYAFSAHLIFADWSNYYK